MGSYILVVFCNMILKYKIFVQGVTYGTKFVVCMNIFFVCMQWYVWTWIAFNYLTRIIEYDKLQ